MSEPKVLAQRRLSHGLRRVYTAPVKSYVTIVVANPTRGKRLCRVAFSGPRSKRKKLVMQFPLRSRQHVSLWGIGAAPMGMRVGDRLFVQCDGGSVTVVGTESIP